MISVWRRWADLLSPRSCAGCHCRLAPGEDFFCSRCHLEVSRTYYHLSPYDNEMARLLWGRASVERCTAFAFYTSKSNICRPLYRLKYGHHPEVGVALGRLVAQELHPTGFFEGIDFLLAMPLAKIRERERGYNQCEKLAEGIIDITGLTLLRGVVVRVKDTETQTRKKGRERIENVKNAFALAENASELIHRTLLRAQKQSASPAERLTSLLNTLSSLIRHPSLSFLKPSRWRVCRAWAAIRHPSLSFLKPSLSFLKPSASPPHPLVPTGLHILLIDDVITTGSTLCACMQALKKLPGVKISVLTVGFSSSACPLGPPPVEKTTSAEAADKTP